VNKVLALSIPTIFSIVGIVSGCSSQPTLGAYQSAISFWCFQDENAEYRNYEANVFDANDKLVSTSRDVEIKVWNDFNGGRYLTGQCQLQTVFADIPLEGGPYVVEYRVDGEVISETDEFDSSELTPINE
jgi:hypothetical protein